MALLIGRMLVGGLEEIKVPLDCSRYLTEVAGGHVEKDPQTRQSRWSNKLCLSVKIRVKMMMMMILQLILDVDSHVICYLVLLEDPIHTRENNQHVWVNRNFKHKKTSSLHPLFTLQASSRNMPFIKSYTLQPP